MDQIIHGCEPSSSGCDLSRGVPSEDQDCAMMIHMKKCQWTLPQRNQHSISQLEYFWDWEQDAPSQPHRAVKGSAMERHGAHLEWPHEKWGVQVITLSYLHKLYDRLSQNVSLPCITNRSVESTFFAQQSHEFRQCSVGADNRKDGKAQVPHESSNFKLQSLLILHPTG